MRSVASRSNPLVKRLHALASSARERRHLNQTVLDGWHLVATARDAGVALQEVVVSDQGLARDEVAAFLASAPDLDVVHMPDTLFAHVSPVDTPSGLLAVMALPEPPPQRPFSESLLILDRLQDPGNVGTIIRTAAAAAIHDVLLTPGCAHAWSPRVLRAGMGAHFSVRIHHQVDVIERLQGYPGQVLATALCGWGRPLFDYELDGPVAWLFGGEGTGLSDEMVEFATGVVLIPMPGKVESLNVAAAAAVCLFEQVRQMRHHRLGH
jgi:RNA methyltransferase, TrmH family